MRSTTRARLAMCGVVHGVAVRSARNILWDFRGVDAGAEARMREAVAASEERTKRAILESMDRLQGRSGEGDANV